MKRLLFPLLLLLSTVTAFSQEILQVTGSVSDSLTGEPLIGATVYVKGTTGGTTTDSEGNFVVNVPSGKVSLTFSYIGYTPETIEMVEEKTTPLKIFLNPAVTESGEVVITARNAKSNTGSTRTGIVELTAKEINRLPTMMGEADLIRALHYSPGIQNSGDGNAAFYV